MRRFRGFLGASGSRMNCHQTKNPALTTKTPSETQKFSRWPAKWLYGSVRSVSSYVRPAV